VGSVDGWVYYIGVVIVEGNGQFWGEFGASHCNQWGLCDAALLILHWTGLVEYLIIVLTESDGQSDDENVECSRHQFTPKNLISLISILNPTQPNRAHNGPNRVKL